MSDKDLVISGCFFFFPLSFPGCRHDETNIPQKKSSEKRRAVSIELFTVLLEEMKRFS